ncbi:MAG TPA: tRNA (adenosine(37)-N6)-threonylcarbamoyltransferase complex dimerization subunit type 1 TsaB [Candidatus Saccharimonadales bacterium]|nr:tRNA (adenosine(37)-N6)-threonylcarbamoyltransferase complex dimerization subunit type 1 TsaB [Candidatus Saccharimonadales bacterium]
MTHAQGKVILAIRTDKAEAEIGLFADRKKLAGLKWQADRQLAQELNQKILEILNKSSIPYDELSAILVFKGPGSFTGLRIGFSVANALAYSLAIPVVSASGPNWLEEGLAQVLSGANEKIALPNYGAPAKVTKPKK